MWLNATYPFIRLVYVPPKCTPVGQPMDAGIIAKHKGKGRKHYGKWATHYTVNALNNGVAPEDINLPFDAQSNKQNLTVCWSLAAGDIMAEEGSVSHCWESCCDGKLMTAWDPAVQAEAVQQKFFIFPKVAGAAAELEAAEPENTCTGHGICEDYEDQQEQHDYIDSIVESDESSEWSENEICDSEAAQRDVCKQC